LRFIRVHIGCEIGCAFALAQLPQANSIGSWTIFTSLRFRRVLALALILGLPTAGCYARHDQRFSPSVALDDIEGLKTRSGEEIRFAVDGATITNDTLFANGRAGPLKVPTDSIARVTQRRFSILNTTGLIVVSVAAAAAALFVATCCSFPP
jgi:hypothetical protein